MNFQKSDNDLNHWNDDEFKGNISNFNEDYFTKEDIDSLLKYFNKYIISEI